MKIKLNSTPVTITPGTSQRNAPVVKRQGPIHSEVKVDHDCLTAIKKNSETTKRTLPCLNQEIKGEEQ